MSALSWVRRFAWGPVSPRRYLSWTRAALWSLTVIVVSGGAVRLSGSGLGCSDWPNCEEGQFVADLEFHALIEFANRLFTGVVAVAVIGAVLTSLRRQPRRIDLIWLSWGLVAGVLAQVVLGGLLVATELDPRFTMGHFLLSMVLLANAVVLMDFAGRDRGRVAGLASGSSALGETGEGGMGTDSVGANRAGKAEADRASEARVKVASGVSDSGSKGTLAPLAWIVTTLGGVLLVSGTIVTGSGPHSGSDEAEVANRLPFLVREVTRVHSIIAIILIASLVWLLRQAHLQGKLQVRRQGETALALLVIQGAVGYWQYFTGVPVFLVGVHILGACLAWIAIVRLHLSVLEAKGSALTAGEPALSDRDSALSNKNPALSNKNPGVSDENAAHSTKRKAGSR